MKASISALTSFATLTSAARLLLQVPTTALLNPSTLASTTHATLQSSGPPLDAYLTRSNTFNFNNVSAGSYLATVHCRDYAFEPLRIDVTLEEAVEGSGERKEVIKAWQTFLGNEWENKGESRGEGGNGLVIEARPIAPKYFYQERQGFSPLSFLKNPMILMAVVSMGLIFGMPKLMENMDPEMKEEFEEMQKNGVMGSGTTNTAQQIQNFDLASWMAGKTDTGSASTGAQSPAGQAKKR
ncbi:er membrane protein complex subunit-like protein [Stemphylium lycopersici]|uniref:Er membrane protein complex subunit-like protein n=1 Tax=Stemphylium lycopersici TaxID=183478 RepID=A0A364MZD5_STELY|nr:er membrane protein complex subunit-like protein [Stemphylium lycopersici]